MPPKEPDKLLEFVTSLAGEQILKVEEDLGSGYFKLNISEAERRQARHDIRSVEDVVVEMVRNSRDAGATDIYVASAKDSAGLRQLTVIDDGDGVPADFHDSIFEPRVTSKIDQVIEDRFGIHGRGMALYSIRSSTDEVRLIASEPGRGAIFSLSVHVDRLRERKDQSTFPKLRVSGRDKVKILSGPHNIVRHLVEMSLDSPDVDIFFGTPAEILATLRLKPPETLSQANPIWDPVHDASNAEFLSETSAAMGLKCSPRTCQRILSGGIEPVHSIKYLLQSILGNAMSPRIVKRKSVSKISQADLDQLAKDVGETFRNLGSKYFLQLKGEPKVSSTKSKITVEFQIDSDESW